MSRPAIALLVLLVVLVAANVSTGAALVMTTYQARALFQEHELLKAEENRLRGDLSALRIELSYKAGHSVIYDFARDELGMVEPDADLTYIRTAQ